MNRTGGKLQSRQAHLARLRAVRRLALFRHLPERYACRSHAHAGPVLRRVRASAGYWWHNAPVAQKLKRAFSSDNDGAEGAAKDVKGKGKAE